MLIKCLTWSLMLGDCSINVAVTIAKILENRKKARKANKLVMRESVIFYIQEQ